MTGSTKTHSLEETELVDMWMGALMSGWRLLRHINNCGAVAVLQG